MTHGTMNTLLDKLIADELTEDEREELLAQLRVIQVDAARPAADRMAAILLRASLEAKAIAGDGRK